MATVAQLNVEIGARVAELQKGLRDAARELNKAGKEFGISGKNAGRTYFKNLSEELSSSAAKLGNIGRDLTTSLSIPLGLAGVAAISAAGDIESLTLALKSQLGTAEAASNELALLTEAAKNPGLGLEQAVRGSVRLQGVAFSAEEARNVLVQMGNAIAATGGSAQELDNVTRQFAQMTSKGRVLQEDVSILSENMPGLAQLMQKAFGTQSVEAIRAMGVSGKEFVLQITKAAEELPRVESGIKNSIGNALDSLKQSVAKVGFAINNAFNVTGAIETFADFALRLAEGFSSLNPVLQTTILSIAGVAIAAGPLISAFGAIKGLGAQLVSLASTLAGGFRVVAGAVLNSIVAFQALNTAMKVTVIGAALAAITALYFAYDSYTNSLTAAEAAQKSVNDVQLRASNSIAGQKAEVDGLVRAYTDEGATLKQKRNILTELKKISPEYFGTLKVGKGDVEALTAATKLYSAELLRVAKVTAAKERIVEIEKALLSLNKTAEPSTLQTFGNIILSGGNSFRFAGEQAKSYTDNLNEQKKALDAESAALIGLVTEQTLADAATNKLKDRTKDLTDAVGGATPKIKVLKEVLSDVSNATETARLLGEDEDIAKVKELEKGIKKLIDVGFKPASAEVQNLKAQLDAINNSVIGIDIIRKPTKDALGNEIESKGVLPVASQAPERPAPTPRTFTPISAEIEASIKAFEAYAEKLAYVAEVQQQVNDKTFNFKTGLAEVSETLLKQGNVMGSVFAGMGDAIAQAANSGVSSFAKLGLAAAGAAAKIIRAYIQQGVAAAVAKALQGIPFPFNLAAAAAAGGIAAALFTNLIGKVGVKGFAAGTRDAPGGLALVGERGPELVNLPKHSQVFNAGVTSTALRGGQNLNITGEFVARGTEMVLVIDRTRAKENRFK